MKLIKLTETHYIIVDDSKIKEGDWYLKNNTLVTQSHIIDDTCKKITHSTQPLEEVRFLLRNEGKAYFNKIQELSLQEVKELIGEVDVEKKMISPYPVNTQNNVDWCNGYQRGYNQALEDNKDRKYTEEDIHKAIQYGREVHYINDQPFIQSLQSKTEWEVEIIDGKLKLK